MRVSMADDRFLTPKHRVPLNNTFLRLLMFGRRVASFHQYVGDLNWDKYGCHCYFEGGYKCHLFHKVDHEETTEHPDFSKRPTLKYNFSKTEKVQNTAGKSGSFKDSHSVYKLTLLYIVL